MRFEYADDRMPAAVNAEGVTYYLTYDQVGSLRVVADGAGNVVKKIDYDSFGNIINDTNPSFEVSFGFAGGLHDRDTGLVRFGYRDYDPDIGRWTAKDPIGFAGGDTDLYGYVLSDPINFVDPFGLSSEVLDSLDTMSDDYATSKELREYLVKLVKEEGTLRTKIIDCEATKEEKKRHQEILHEIPSIQKKILERGKSSTNAFKKIYKKIWEAIIKFRR